MRDLLVVLHAIQYLVAFCLKSVLVTFIVALKRLQKHLKWSVMLTEQTVKNIFFFNNFEKSKYIDLYLDPIDANS